MKMIIEFRTAVSWLILGLLMACTSSTMITGSWTSPRKTAKTYDHILVAALTDNVSAKGKLEEDFASAFADRGIAVKKSIDVFPPNFSKENNNKEALLGKIRNDGTDAILTISLVDKETETRYVPGTVSYAPYPFYPYYGSFWGYYSFVYPQVYSPGYYTEEKVYYIETNLYDAQTEDLIWSAQSETYNPANLDRFSEDFVNAIIRKMERDKVL